jgi:hypothetical protein
LKDSLSIFFLGILLMGLPRAAAVEYSDSPNILVTAPDRELADAVQARAKQFRREVAREWLGRELPEGLGVTMISVKISTGESECLTWPVTPGSKRRYHKVWLTTTRASALGHSLRHEMVHVVLATAAFPQRLPVFLEEGIATREDPPARLARLRQTARQQAQSGATMDFERLLTASGLNPLDGNSYSSALSLCEFLLTRGDRQTLLQFGLSGQRTGWPAALRQYYGLVSMRDLESAWRNWALRSSHG